MRKNLIFLIAIIFLGNLSFLYSQNDLNKENTGDAFFFDCIVFRADSLDYSRLDSYIAIPYKSITFIKSDNGEYVSKYQIMFSCYDNYGNSIIEKNYDKIAKASTFFASQGGNGEFDYSSFSIFLKEGTYKVVIKITDYLSKNSYDKSREISVVNYKKYPFAMSGLMLASSIFETEGNNSITPFLSDNISSLENGFFVFFETYNQKSEDTVDFVYQIVLNDKVKDQSSKITKIIPSGTSQQFIKISKLSNLLTGTYYLKVIALRHSSDSTFDESQYLALTQRTITYIPSLAGNIIDNLNDAVKELRYVATQAQINYIDEAQTQEDKLNRFKQFWADLDPTPNTPRNEAFEEYYSRVDFANKKFKSYLPGWQTDMGMVYIIFGPPSTTERRQDYYNPNRIYEKWTYYNNREIIFVDNNGFGDFRLLSPTTIAEKYDYYRNK
ncbi:MAG: GWxTD domain-containing protein [Candidatus Kapaibacteriota bacterium]